MSARLDSAASIQPLVFEIAGGALAFILRLPALGLAAPERDPIVGGAALGLGTLLGLAKPVEIDDRSHSSAPSRPLAAARSRPARYRIVGMTNSAPERMPAGQREVTVFSRV